MAAAHLLTEYLSFQDMRTGPLKMSLSEFLDKIHEENAEYVFTLLKADVDVFISNKVSQEVQNITGVVQCI